MEEEEYIKWEENINNHPEMKKRNKSIFNNNMYRKRNTFNIIKDICLLILITSGIFLFSIRIFYPENYKDIVNSVCSPTYNITDEGIINNINNSAVCSPVLNCPNITFPQELVIRLLNNS